MVTNVIPNVLAFPLAVAIARLNELGVDYEIVKTLPFKKREEFIWREQDAYVVKQTAALDHKVILTVACKCRKEV